MILRGFFVYRCVWGLLGCSSVKAVKIQRYSVHGWQDLHWNFEVCHARKSAVLAWEDNRLTCAETGDFGGSLWTICGQFSKKDSVCL